MFGGFPFGQFFEQEGGHGPEEADSSKYYDLLEVDRSASCADIKKKYKVLAKIKHPDKGGDPKIFAEITQAAEILSDPEKRRIYDRYGEKGINSGMSGQSPFDILSGRGKTKEKKSQDSGQQLPVTLSELYHGCIKTVNVTRNRCCSECEGKGGSKIVVCSDCRGQGMVKKLIQLGPGMYGQTAGPCDECHGQGRSVDPKFKCKKCKGKGVFTENKEIQVAIDKGCPHKHRYTFYGEGDEEPGLRPGDFIVIVLEVEHQVFKRKKSDLVMAAKISLKEALTGFCLKIEHLDGVKIVESVAGDIVRPGDIRTVEELGMPIMKTPFKFGNLFIHFDVDFPAPGSLEVSQVQKILSNLPGDSEMPSTEPALRSIPYDKSQVTENETTIHSDYKEDEEDDPRMAGGQRVQCSGIIF